ncbi:iron-sulfur cluster assembly protein [Gordonia hydrophobica]|uniref:50S ribosomal protein L22 n=1 Tax=Gordonia hydrophobica TaxID=40516 RepID=A0ABZ2U537_9ACTN|nr:iron-sulfur cluster assembly protein [Gordonia hydrophobica]MBM7368078.1 metal-sulfur cluster biosynthetic enzyme/ribosomal protein L22 [Gordonia hydrophobica]
MTATLESSPVITVAEHQVRIAVDDALSALDLVIGESAADARTRLRFGPGRTYELLARILDTALIRAEQRGLHPDALLVGRASAVAAEDIVRVRRKAHGVADWITTATSDVTIVLQPQGMASLPEVVPNPPVAHVDADGPAAAEPAVESAAAAAVREALYEVIDPDLGVNVVDLGFIRRIVVDDAGFATITMTLTSPACPLTGVMEGQIASLLADAGTEFAVEWDWVPAWRPSDITEDGRDQLRAIGFSNF